MIKTFKLFESNNIFFEEISEDEFYDRKERRDIDKFKDSDISSIKILLKKLSSKWIDYVIDDWMSDKYISICGVTNFIIYAYSDEYFLVENDYGKYYECDQIEGVLKFIEQHG